jgi:hypothetical protein
MTSPVFRPLRRASATLVLAVSLAPLSCSRTPDEPNPPPSTVTSAPALKPLAWTVPGAWTALDAPRSGPKKAAYRTTKAGDDKEEAQVEVFFHGTGAAGDPDKRFKEWFEQFDGDVGKGAARERFKAGTLEVETVEVSGTYKIALGPPVGPKKQAPMQMVKQGYRLLGAVVKTPDRGNWFFKLAGPDDTVKAARDAFRGMLESAQ